MSARNLCVRRSDNIELVISILFRRACSLVCKFFCLDLWLLYWSRISKTVLLIKLNKMIDIFVFESFSNDVYRYTFWELFLTAPTKHEINVLVIAICMRVYEHGSRASRVLFTNFLRGFIIAKTKLHRQNAVFDRSFLCVLLWICPVASN